MNFHSSKIRQPSNLLDNEHYDNPEISEAYKSFIFRTIQLFSVNPVNPNLKKEAETIFNIERDLGLVILKIYLTHLNYE